MYPSVHVSGLPLFYSISLHRSTSEPRALNKMTTMSTVSSIEAHATFCLLARHVLRLRVSAWRHTAAALPSPTTSGLQTDDDYALMHSANYMAAPPPPSPPPSRPCPSASNAISTKYTYVCIHIHTHVHVYTHARSASSVAFASVACLSPPCLASHHDNKINCNFQASAIMRPFLLF